MPAKEEKVKQRFNEIKDNMNPKSNIVKDCIIAFIIGGLICDVGQFFNNWLLSAGIPKDDAGTWVSIIMIFIGAFLTGIGVYDKLGSFAGAGSIVPITGFANSIVSPAIEFKKEGYILGVGAKMFTIAGPVLVYCMSSSIIMGFIYYFFK